MMALYKVKKIAPYVIISLAALYLYSLANTFEYVARAGNLGPDFWPKAILVLTMVICLYEIVKNVFSSPINVDGEEAKAETGAGDNSDAKETKRSYTALLLIGIVMTMAYVFFVEILGFLLCTFLYLVLFMYLGRYRRVLVILANSFIGTLLTAIIFMKVVYVSLPHGKGPFAAIELFVLNLMGIK